MWKKIWARITAFLDWLFSIAAQEEEKTPVESTEMELWKKLPKPGWSTKYIDGRSVICDETGKPVRDVDYIDYLITAVKGWGMAIDRAGNAEGMLRDLYPMLDAHVLLAQEVSIFLKLDQKDLAYNMQLDEVRKAFRHAADSIPPVYTALKERNDRHGR